MGVVGLCQGKTLRLAHLVAAAGLGLILAAGPVRAAVSTTAEGTDAELARLRDFLTGSDRTFSTRRDAAQVLMEKDTPEARAVLLEVLAPPTLPEAARAVLEVLASRDAADPALVDPLFALLESDDADLRHAAATAFGAYQGKAKVLDGLKALAEGTSTGVEARLAAVEALGYLPDKRAIATLVALTGASSEPVAAAAADALAEMTGRTDLPPTAEAWQGWWQGRRDEPESRLLAGLLRRFRARLQRRTAQHEAVRKRLVEHLTTLYDAADTKAKGTLAREHLADAVPAVRALGARQAARVASSALAAANGTGRKAYQDLVSALPSHIDDASAQVRAAVATALAAWQETDAGPALLARLGDETDPAARAALAAALGDLRVAEAVPRLVAMLESPTQEAVVAAAGALGQIGDRADGHLDAVKPALETLGRLARTAGPAAVREAACLALAKIAPPSAEAILAAALDDPQPSVRYSAARGIGNLDPVGTETVAALAGRLQDKNKGVRQAVAAALAHLGGDQAAAQMAERLKPGVETDPGVRNALWDAIRTLADASSPDRAAALGDVFFARGGPDQPDDMQRAAELYQVALSKILAAQRGGQQAVTLYEKLVDAYIAAGTPDRAVPTLRQLIVLTPAENAARLRELNRQLGLILLAKDPCADSIPPLTAAMKAADDDARNSILDAVRDRAQALLKAKKAVGALDLLTALKQARPDWGGTDRAAALKAAHAEAAEAALAAVLPKLSGPEEQAAAAAATLGKIGAPAAGPLLDLLETAAKEKQDALQARVLAVLESVTGRTDHGYDPEAPLADRLQHIEAWRKRL